MRAGVVLGVSGGIAAFRAAELCRGLVKAGCDVYPILTRNAARFISPRTLAVLAGHAAQVSLWRDRSGGGVDHIELARRADLLLVAPATANLLAKLAAGIADDALTTYALAHRRRVIVAPAMNTAMWEHPATCAAVATLRERGVEVIEPDAGLLACGDIGAGRLPEVQQILSTALAALPRRGPLAGVRVLVTAGPTREPLDAVRVITNRSSGRMGAALAAEADRLGARVTLLAGPGVLVPVGVSAERFETAGDLGRALAEHAAATDVVLHAAAVADFRPTATVAGKMDRRAGGTELRLEPVPDLARDLARRDGSPYLVIFAAETAATLEEGARRKLTEKAADAVVANPIDEPELGMETARNRAVLLTRAGRRRVFPPQDKESLARELLLTLAAEIVAGITG